jgi:hypothetical protein
VAIETPANRATSAIVEERVLNVMIALKAFSENAFRSIQRIMISVNQFLISTCYFAHGFWSYICPNLAGVPKQEIIEELTHPLS